MRKLAALCLVLVAAPAQAQSDPWTHAKSGLSLPAEIGAMRRGEERDLSNGKTLDVMIQFGQQTEPVTIYVYRSAFPNPALWFERIRHAMKQNVGSPTERVAPRSFTFAGAPAPNGLREEIAIPNGGSWKTTAVAIAQVGEWIVKTRITSQTLDSAGIAAKMDSLLAAFRAARTPAVPLPLIVPAPCDAKSAAGGKPLKTNSDEAMAGAMVTGVMVMAQARGQTGLASDPGSWCHESSEIPAQYISLYRQRDGKAWVALVGDAGIAISGHSFAAPASGGAATYSSDPASTKLAALFDALPSPDAAIVQALPIAIGQERGLLEMSVGEEEGGSQ